MRQDSRYSCAHIVALHDRRMAYTHSRDICDRILPSGWKQPDDQADFSGPWARAFWRWLIHESEHRERSTERRFDGRCHIRSMLV